MGWRFAQRLEEHGASGNPHYETSERSPISRVARTTDTPAQIRPTVEQTSKMHLLEDRHSPAAHTGLWKDVMPSDETIERIVTGTVVIREHASKPL